MTYFRRIFFFFLNFFEFSKKSVFLLPCSAFGADGLKIGAVKENDGAMDELVDEVDDPSVPKLNPPLLIGTTSALRKKK